MGSRPVDLGGRTATPTVAGTVTLGVRQTSGRPLGGQTVTVITTLGGKSLETKHLYWYKGRETKKVSVLQSKRNKDRGKVCK